MVYEISLSDGVWLANTELGCAYKQDGEVILVRPISADGEVKDDPDEVSEVDFFRCSPEEVAPVLEMFLQFNKL